MFLSPSAYRSKRLANAQPMIEFLYMQLHNTQTFIFRTPYTDPD